MENRFSTTERSKISGPYRATKLWDEMVHIFRTGVPLKKHWRHMKQYENCFTATEAVHWFHQTLKKNPNFDSNVMKEQTIQLLDKFLKGGIIQKVNTSGTTDNCFKENGEIYKLKRYPLLQESDSSVSLVPQNFETNQKHHISTSYTQKQLVNDVNNEMTLKCAAERAVSVVRELPEKNSMGTQITMHTNNGYVLRCPDRAAEREECRYVCSTNPAYQRSLSGQTFSKSHNHKQLSSSRQLSNCGTQSSSEITNYKQCHFQSNYERLSHFQPSEKTVQRNCFAKSLMGAHAPFQCEDEYCDMNYKKLGVMRTSNKDEPPDEYYSENLPRHNPNSSSHKYSDIYSGICPISSRIVGDYNGMSSGKNFAVDIKTVGRKAFREVQNPKNIVKCTIDAGHKSYPAKNECDLPDKTKQYMTADESCLLSSVPQNRSAVVDWKTKQQNVREYCVSKHISENMCEETNCKHHQGCLCFVSLNQNWKDTSRNCSKIFRANSSNATHADSDKNRKTDFSSQQLPERNKKSFKRKNSSGSLWDNLVARLCELLPEIPVIELLPKNLPYEWLLQNVSHIELPDPQLPYHIISAVNCLMHWPAGFRGESLSDIRNYFCNWMEPIITFALCDIISKAFSFAESVFSCPLSECAEFGDALSFNSVEKLVLSMASPSRAAIPAEKVSDSKFQQINENKLLPTVLPPNSCFETAFTSDNPVTRIVPQQTVDTLHFSSSVQKLVNADVEHNKQETLLVSLKRNSSAPNLLDAVKGFSGRPLAKHTKSMRETNKADSFDMQRKTPVENPVIKSGRYSWYRSRKAAAREPSIKHLRSKSGGYVNPALSHSSDDIVPNDLGSVQLDYEAALETINKLMQCTQDQNTSANKSSISVDISGSDSSYYTATSSADSSRRSSQIFALPTDPVKCGSVTWTADGEKICLEVFQLLLLLIPPHHRTRLKLLLSFMKQLAVTSIITEENSQTCLWDLRQVISTFSSCIIYSECGEKMDYSLVERIVDFMITHQGDLFNIPSVLNKLIKSQEKPSSFLASASGVQEGRISEQKYSFPVNQKMVQDKVVFCEQMSSQQFEAQRLRSSQIALSELLDQILSDPKMKSKERKRRLKMFKESYPHIFAMRFPEGDVKDSEITDKNRGILHFPTFARLKSIRV